ncbi:MAG: putative mitochondrial protein, conserved [Alectoria sarmentosa]|nr:MAG: putative mitochondrial protein, conserved [Alectoria sarmentosa]
MQYPHAFAFRSQLIRRLFSSSTHARAAPPFASGPAPPRLPKEDQELYEELQRSSTGAFSTPKPTVVINQSPASVSDASKRSRLQINQSPHTKPATEPSTEQKIENINAKVEARGNGDELHPDVRRGVRPEFEGERNPKTGETGGPKNEPLRWGGGVDWSYNGRVTDF